MRIVAYIKSFKEFIPTWIICVFMFVGVFGWTFLIGLSLLIIQYFQRKNIQKKLNQAGHTTADIDNETEIQNLLSQIQQISAKNEALEKEINIKTEKIIEFQNITTETNDNISKLNNKILELSASVEKKDIELEKLSTTQCKKSEKPLENELILPAGKYKGGIDIPLGIYNMKVISGEGNFKTNKPDDIYENISSNPNHGYGFLNEYKNLEISDNTILRISSSAKIVLTLSKKYDFSKEIVEDKQHYIEEHEKLEKEFALQKKSFETEISTIKTELKLLNDECIETYYKFSSYDNITSIDCKNKLLLLKQEEKELREFEKDVLITKKDGGRWKIAERTVRQILRNFNSECDSIANNIDSKNIDKERQKIQKSYETLNKLYSVDGVSLTKDLLRLKLDKITTIYTYKLKQQQEKEIQKAIKEQMLDEAKAEKEIQETKKKIGKLLN